MGTNQVSSLAAKVFITSAYEDPEPLSTFLKDAHLDKYKQHQIVDAPEIADIILFIENSRYHYDPFFRKLKSHPIVKKYPNKVFMYNAHDVPWFILPGLYTCIPKNAFDGDKICASCYIESINPYIRCDFSETPDYLFSFYGNPQSKPRKEIMKLHHKRAVIITSDQKMYSDQKPQDLQIQYADLIANTKFILCPKGIGTSSIRLFETMQAGRVPVIISDDWVRPAGPTWEEFAIFIPEDKVHTIPAVLEREEINWAIKSRLARKAWEDYFAPDSLFNYSVNNILMLGHFKSNLQKNIYFKLYKYFSYYRYYFRRNVIYPGKRLIAKFKN